MQINSTLRTIQSPKANFAQPSQTESFSPAAQKDLVSIGNSVESQDRFDSSAFKGLAVMIYGGAGGLGGGIAGTVVGAACGLSGWGTAAAGLGGVVAGAFIGGAMANN